MELSSVLFLCLSHKRTERKTRCVCVYVCICMCETPRQSCHCSRRTQEIHSVLFIKKKKITVLYSTSKMERKLIQAKDSVRWGHVVSTSHWSKWSWIYIFLTFNISQSLCSISDPLQKGILLVKVPLKRAPLACS